MAKFNDGDHVVMDPDDSITMVAIVPLNQGASASGPRTLCVWLDHEGHYQEHYIPDCALSLKN